MAKFITLDNLSRFKENVDNIIPTKTSELENDSDFAVKNDIPDISDLANKSEIPTKTSQLENDSDFATKSEIPDVSDLASKIEIPTKTSDIENDSGYITVSEIPTDYAKQSDIPTKTSELENDSNFATQSDIPDISNLASKDEIPDISHLADRSDIPTKTSQLINDRNFATREEIPDISILARKNDIPTRTSQLTNDSHFAAQNEIPTKVSQLTNDANFINNTVNNLINYYSKTQTYTKDEIHSLVSNMSSFNALIVDVLPAINISTSTIYLKAKIDGENNDYYNEYLYINDNWELIGSTKINLDNYYTKTQTTDLLNEKANVSDIPTKVSELTNDKNYVVGENGKGLSANDYTDAEKNKLSVLQNYDDSELRNLIDKKAVQSDLVNLANEVYEWEAEIDNLSQNKVDKTITINGQPLSENVHLTIDDIGFTETDPTVPEWAKKPSKPTYEYGEILNTPTIPEGSVLYDTTGQNTDGAMTQKAVTDILGKVDVTHVIPSDQKQYLTWLRNLTNGFQYLYYRDDVHIDENGNLNDIRGVLASLNDIPTDIVKFDSATGITKVGNIGGADYYAQYLKLSIGDGKYLVFNYGISPTSATSGGNVANFKQPLSEILFAIASPDYTSDIQTSRFAIKTLTTSGISFNGGSAGVGVRWIVIGIQ